MDYNKLICTLSDQSEKVYYTIWRESLILYTGHAIVMMLENADSIPDVVRSKCERNDEWQNKIEQYLTPNIRDTAWFTGITFLWGNKETCVYMAQRSDECLIKYPVLVQRKYAEMVGKQVGFIYGSGSSTDPLHIHGLEATAVIWPMRINKTELRRLVDIVNEIDRQMQ